MPTTIVNTTATWQQVATAEQFLIENQSSYDVFIRFDTTTPATDEPAHILRTGEAITRMSLVGNVYVKNKEVASAYLIVTLGA